MERIPILAADLCQRVGIPQARHSQWVGKRLCKKIGPAGATYEDAVELALATSLMEHLKDIDKSRRALSQLRKGTQRTDWSDSTAVVWDEQLELATWAESNEDVGQAVRHGRPVRVLAVGGFVRDVTNSYMQLVADRQGIRAPTE